MKAIQKIKSDLYDKLNELSLEQLYKLADLLEVGFINEQEDKEEIILILSTEQPSKIEEALNKLDR